MLGMQSGGIVLVRFENDGSERRLMASVAPLQEAARLAVAPAARRCRPPRGRAPSSRTRAAVPHPPRAVGHAHDVLEELVLAGLAPRAGLRARSIQTTTENSIVAPAAGAPPTECGTTRTKRAAAMSVAGPVAGWASRERPATAGPPPDVPRRPASRTPAPTSTAAAGGGPLVTSGDGTGAGAALAAAAAEEAPPDEPPQAASRAAPARISSSDGSCEQRGRPATCAGSSARDCPVGDAGDIGGPLSSSSAPALHLITAASACTG